MNGLQSHRRFARPRGDRADARARRESAVSTKPRKRSRPASRETGMGAPRPVRPRIHVGHHPFVETRSSAGSVLDPSTEAIPLERSESRRADPRLRRMRRYCQAFRYSTWARMFHPRTRLQPTSRPDSHQYVWSPVQRPRKWVQTRAIQI